MIILKQLPLRELDTFEEELLFFLANKITSIKSTGPKSIIGERTMAFCNFTLIEPLQMSLSDLVFNVINIFTKYDKCFRNEFEITLKKGLNSRWELFIDV